MKKRNKKNLMIGLLCTLLIFMGVGYAIMNQRLSISGVANVEGKWDVHISKIELISKKGMAVDKSHTFSNLNAEFQTETLAPGDSLEYEITIINAGNIDAVVNNVNAEMTGSPTIKFTVSGIEKGNVITNGSSKTVRLVITFDSNATIIPSLKVSTLTIEISCIQKSSDVSNEGLVVYQPVLTTAENNRSAESYFLGGSLKRNQIESITFTDTSTVPANAKGSFDVSSDSKGGVMAWYFDKDNNNLYELVIGQDGGVIAPTSMNWYFSYLTNLTEIDLKYLDTTNVTSMSKMFYQLKKLKSLDVSSFNTSNVTNMDRMFYQLTALESLNLSNLNTSKVMYMGSMFKDLTSLTSLNVSSFDTSNVVDMNSMFYNLRNLVSLDLSNFNTSKVTNMSSMFLTNYNLSSLNVRSFDTSNVTNMNQMFAYTNLTELDLSSFTTTKVTDIGKMFNGSSNLKKINLKSAVFNTGITDNNAFYLVPSDVTIITNSSSKDYIQGFLPNANIIVEE